jgi:hypothetical protein
MKRIESPPVIVPMLRVAYAADFESTVDDVPRRPRTDRPRRKRVMSPQDAQNKALEQVRTRLLKMIVENERERSHDHRAS